MGHRQLGLERETPRQLMAVLTGLSIFLVSITNLLAAHSITKTCPCNKQIFSAVKFSNEYIKNKKIRYTPANPSFFLYKVRFKGVYIARTCFPDDTE